MEIMHDGTFTCDATDAIVNSQKYLCILQGHMSLTVIHPNGDCSTINMISGIVLCDEQV